MIIYKITNKINDKIYIGQTKRTLEKRIEQHKHTKTSCIGKAIHEYGLNNFDYEVIEICKSFKEAQEREKFWISHFNCKFPNDYNKTDGGEGVRGFSEKIVSNHYKVNNENKLNFDIGSRIRKMRELQGKTRDQVAEEADISSQFLFYIETGRKSMAAKTIVNLAKALNVTTDFILLGAITPISRIVNNLEGLPVDKLNLAEKFLEDFSTGARNKINKNK